MGAINVKYDVPEDIEKGLDIGKYSRHGNIIRDNENNVYHSHLKEMSEKDNSNINKTIVTVAVVSGVSFIGYKTYKYLQKKGYFISIYKKSTDNFKKAFEIYLENIKNGTLSTEIIEQLIKALDDLIQLYKNKNKKIKLTIEELEGMLALISDYTIKFTQANNMEFSIDKSQTDNKIYDKIIDFKKYLNVQNEVIKKNA